MPSLEQVKELRARTGCGIVDCKAALEKSGDDIEEAITLLRKLGQVKAAKKADRATKEGVIATYIHSNNKVAAMVALLCETDFVARNEKFQTLGHDIALHIVASEPLVVKPEDISPEILAHERQIAEEQAKASNKPAEIQEKIIAGKLKTYAEEKALLTQPFVKDPSRTVGDVIKQAISELGENISVNGFSRLSI